MIRAGLVGYGYWGPNLARNLRATEGIELAAVCDAAAAQRALAEREHPGINTCAEAARLIDDTTLGAIVIATPVATHFALAQAALAAGKHVLLEKPMAASAHEAQQLVAQAERAGRVLMVDHPFVFAPAVQRMKALLDAGQLGQLHYYDSVRANLGRFRADVNVLWDLAVHDLSILDFLLGAEMPVEVSAVGATCLPQAGAGGADLAYLTLRYAGGLLAHVHANWLAPVKIRRTILGGSRSMLVFDDVEASEKLRLYDRGLELGGEAGHAAVLAAGHPAGDVANDGSAVQQRRIGYRTGDMWAPHLPVVEPLLSVCRAFRDAIAGGAAPPSSGISGVRVLRVLEAASASLAARGAPLATPAPGPGR